MAKETIDDRKTCLAACLNMTPLAPILEAIAELPKELTVSSVTGLALWIGRSAQKRIKNFLLHRRFPVAGDYITYYDDKVDGRVERRKATLTIQQLGREFSGKTKNVDDGREWDLRGTILDGGYISGSYGHLDPNDPSKGGFFMEPNLKLKGTYEGHWSGYDSLNRKVESGEYIWRRRLPVQVRTLGSPQSLEIPRILAIFAEALGDRFITEDQLKEYLGSDRTRAVQGAYVGQDLIAVRTLIVLDEARKKRFEESVRKAGGQLSLKNYKVGALASSAVEKRFRRQGVGTMLVQSGLEHLRKQGCTLCVATAWESQSIESSAKVLEATGFKLLAVAERFWREDSLTRGYDCPRCGGPPCECSARFYSRSLLH